MLLTVSVGTWFARGGRRVGPWGLPPVEPVLRRLTRKKNACALKDAENRNTTARSEKGSSCSVCGSRWDCPGSFLEEASSSAKVVGEFPDLVVLLMPK